MQTKIARHCYYLKSIECYATNCEQCKLVATTLRYAIHRAEKVDSLNKQIKQMQAEIEAIRGARTSAIEELIGTRARAEKVEDWKNNVLQILYRYFPDLQLNGVEMSAVNIGFIVRSRISSLIIRAEKAEANLAKEQILKSDRQAERDALAGLLESEARRRGNIGAHIGTKEFYLDWARINF